MGIIRYCLLKFKKLSWLQILEIFSTATFPVMVAKIFFSLEYGFSLTKATLYLKMKKIWVGQHTKVPILPDSYRQWLLKVTSATKWLCHLRHKFRIFLFCRKVMFRFQDIQVFVFSTIPWFSISDVMMSITTWDRVQFWVYLLNHNSLSHQTWPVDRYKQQG